MAIRSRAGSPTVWLEVAYEGLDAPTAFFADLALIGWSPPTIAPPPHHAIDWSRPNEATGDRFTLRDYRIEGAIAQPPGGSGARSTWTDAERSGHLAALARVLDRHTTIEVEDPAGIVRAHAAPPAPPTRAGGALPPPPTSVAATPGTAFAPSAGATAVLITAPIKPSLGPRVDDALVALGVTAVFDNQERRKVERYRGASYETTTTELHVAAVVTVDQLATVTATLADLGLVLTFAEVEDVTVTPGPTPVVESAAPTVSTSAEAVAPSAPERPLARVVALADPRAADAVAAVIASLGLVETSLTRTTRTEISTYRGSRSEREVPTLRVEIRVPEPHARLVANHLADATRLRLRDLDRIWIDPPATAVAPGPAAAGPAATAAPVAADPGLPPPPPGSTFPTVPSAAPPASVPSTAPDAHAHTTVDTAVAVTGDVAPRPVFDVTAAGTRLTPAFMDHARS